MSKSFQHNKKVGGAKSNNQHPAYKTVSQKAQRSEFGQALSLALQKGLITRNSIDRQLRLNNQIDQKRTHPSTPRQFFDKRIVLKSQEANRNVQRMRNPHNYPHHKTMRSSEQVEKLEESRFLLSVYGQQALDIGDSSKEKLDLADKPGPPLSQRNSTAEKITGLISARQVSTIVRGQAMVDSSTKMSSSRGLHNPDIIHALQEDSIHPARRHSQIQDESKTTEPQITQESKVSSPSGSNL